MFPNTGARGLEKEIEMKAQLIKIGNSRGLRLLKAVIEQMGLGDEIELEVQSDQLVIRAAKHPREGWDEACRAMAACGDDQLIDGPLTQQSSFDREEWKW